MKERYKSQEKKRVTRFYKSFTFTWQSQAIAIVSMPRSKPDVCIIKRDDQYIVTNEHLQLCVVKLHRSVLHALGHLKKLGVIEPCSSPIVPAL